MSIERDYRLYNISSYIDYIVGREARPSIHLTYGRRACIY